MTYANGLPTGLRKSFDDIAPESAKYMHDRGWPPLTGETTAIRMRGEHIRKRKYDLMISLQIWDLKQYQNLAKITEAQWWIDHRGCTAQEIMEHDKDHRR